jgi:hypothetical protein
MTIYVVEAKNIDSNNTFQKRFTNGAKALDFFSFLLTYEDCNFQTIPSTPEGTEKYLLPIVNTWRQHFSHYKQKYVSYINGQWGTNFCLDDEDASLGAYTTFTKEQLKTAPDWVKKIVPVRAFTFNEIE